MHANIEMVTPAIAKNWIKRNKSNRELRPSHVAGLSAAMKAGDFPLTHQGIAFSDDGELLDGQHRLHAVVAAGVPVSFMVIRGASKATFAYLDQGAKRNAADILGLDRRTSEVTSFVSRLLAPRATPAQLQAVSAVVKEPSIALVEFCSTSNKIFSSAPMRVAAVTNVLMGEDRGYVFDLYRNLCISKVSELPPIAQSAVSQVLRHELSATDKSDLLARGMKIFRKDAANNTRLQVKDASVEVDQVRQFYRAIVQGF